MSLLNRSSLLKREDAGFILAIFLLVFIYFYKILSLQYGFYSGDHRQQHYPWAFFYWEQLRQGMLPWWTSLMGCGFPLLAEGQVGALYPLNYFFYRIFPFDFAYTYNILAHYCLGGVFFYAWLRRQELLPVAAFSATLIYLYGTAQGGYFYNIISLKTLIWFPLSLMLVQMIMLESRFRSLFALALAFSMQWLGGYLQYAVYSILFCGLSSLFCFVMQARRHKWREGVRGLGSVFVALSLSVCIAFPQLMSTWELSRLSNRFSFPPEFAFVGSLNPLALATLFFPHWDGFLGGEIYFGVAGILFLITGFFYWRNDFFRHALLGVLVAIFFALGQWNPIFKWFVEVTGLSFFRIPTKFLYFAAVYGAALCGYGMHHWLINADLKAQTKITTIWIALLVVALVGWGGAFLAFRYCHELIYQMGQQYLAQHFQPSSIHPYSMDIYLTRLKGMIVDIGNLLTLAEPFNRWFLFFMILTPSVYFALRLRMQKIHLFFSLIAVLFLNLWIFGNTSIRGSLRDSSFVSLNSLPVEWLAKQPGRLHRVYQTLVAGDQLPIVPHNHMLKRIELLGLYSPLITQDYYEFMRDLGDANDSNVQLVANEKHFEEASEKVDGMSTAWILADHKFSFDRYDLVWNADGSWLYRNPHAKARVAFRSSDGIETPLKFEDRQNQLTTAVIASQQGEIVVRDTFYPGWQALLNNQRVSIEKEGLFRKIIIPKPGNWQLEMRYESVGRKWLPVSVALILFCLGAFFFPPKIKL